MKIKNLFLTLLVLMCSLTAMADEAEINRLWYELNSSTSQIPGNDEMVLAGKVFCRVSVYATKEGNEDSEVATKDVELNVGAKGDVNGDGTVSPADAIESLYIFFGVGQSSAPIKPLPALDPQ